MAGRSEGPFNKYLVPKPFHNWKMDGRRFRCADCGLVGLSAVPNDWPYEAVGKVTAILQVGDGKTDESFVELPGLKSVGPIQISGFFDDGGYTCSACGVRFYLAPDQPLAEISVGDVKLGPACDRCAMAAIRPSDRSE